MAGKMICWTCGWPEQKKSSTISTDSSKPNRLEKDLDWIRKSGQQAEEQTVKEPTEEKQGCSGCRMILGALFLLIGLASCKSGGYSSSFVFTVLGLVCYLPLMKKWFREGLNDSNS
jgi:protein-arginine kinase activator protein McsA